MGSQILIATILSFAFELLAEGGLFRAWRSRADGRNGYLWEFTSHYPVVTGLVRNDGLGQFVRRMHIT